MPERRREEGSAMECPEEDSQPNRVLGLGDLTLLGVGSVLATGIYMFTGHISKEQSGPSAMISFAIVTVVCCLTGNNSWISSLSYLELQNL